MQHSPELTRKSGRRFVCDSSVVKIVGIKPLNGYMTTLMHFIKCYVGTGIFAMGEGYKHSGLIFGTGFLFVLAAVNLHCQHILIRAAAKIQAEEASEGEVKPSFSETVQYIMEGSTFKWFQKKSDTFGRAIVVFLCTCELGFCCVYFVFIAEHLVQVAENNGLMAEKGTYNNHIMLAIILCPMWVSTFLGSFKLLLPLSIIANILVWTGIIIIYYFTTYQGLPPFNERTLVAPVLKWPFFFGISLYAFEGITFIIPLRNEMKNPPIFSSLFGILNMGMFFVLILYFTVGALGYWKYGDDVESSIFLNLTAENKDLADAVDIIMAIGVLFTFSLHMYIPFEITFPLFYRRFGPFKYGWLVVCLYKSVPVLFTYIMANIIPFLAIFISLVGATAGSFLALIIPAMLEIIGFWEEITKWHVAKDILILFLAIVGTVSGTVVSMMELVEAFHEKYFSE